MIRVQRGKDGPVVEVPRSVSVLGGPEGIQAYVQAWKEGEPCLEGVPFATKPAKDLAAKEGLDAWTFDGLTPGDHRGFTLNEVKDMLPPPPEEQPTPTDEGEE